MSQQQIQLAPTPQVPVLAPFSALAIVGLVLAFFFAPVGVVCSHIALWRIKRFRFRGKMLAIIGICLNWTVIVGTPLIIWFGWIMVLFIFAAPGSAYEDPITFWVHIIYGV